MKCPICQKDASPEPHEEAYGFEAWVAVWTSPKSDEDWGYYGAVIGFQCPDKHRFFVFEKEKDE